MPTKHLSNSTVESVAAPAEGQILYWDDQLQGFGLRVTKNSRVYIVQARVNGKNRRVKLADARLVSAQEARKIAKTKLSEMLHGTDHNAEKSAERSRTVTLVEVYADYCKQRNLRPTTIQTYNDVMERWLKDWHSMRMVDITRAMVRDRYQAILDSVQKHVESKGTKTVYKQSLLSTKSQPGHAGASQTMRLLKSLFNFAMAKYEDANGRAQVAENPVACLSQIKKGWQTMPRRQNVLLPTEFATFYKAVQSLKRQTARDFFMFLLLTGLRKKEAAKLMWDEVVWDERAIMIPGTRTKNHRPHVLPMSDYLYDMLVRRMADRGDSEYVFPGRDKGPGFYSAPYNSLELIAVALGRNLGCHDLRRSFSTVAKSLKIHPYDLKALLNHSGSDVTEGYVISNLDQLREPMQAITDAIIGKIQQPPSPQSNVVHLVDTVRRRSRP